MATQAAYMAACRRGTRNHGDAKQRAAPGILRPNERYSRPRGYHFWFLSPVFEMVPPTNNMHSDEDHRHQSKSEIAVRHACSRKPRPDCRPPPCGTAISGSGREAFPRLHLLTGQVVTVGCKNSDNSSKLGVLAAARAADAPRGFRNRKRHPTENEAK
ncbi:hypothetical protein CPLU01_01033 [Colletotrichum plurivorum]|uniref:Uncharacterized protein n=1 Tax=Colletotrichum plurivorum TaxID=2175906 RepID=A0A8H6NQD1_9PEZI|nr:hypothetical protein CPLU01_01033 [Colletotrichum plurivorum]